MSELRMWINRAREAPWSLWVRQVRAVFRLEFRKCFLSRRFLLIYLLALGPVGLMWIRVLLPPPGQVVQQLGDNSLLFAIVFRTFELRMAVFFGCVLVFMSLFRGEILEKTLHYYLLLPVRRGLVVAGKFLSGVAFASLVFAVGTTATYILSLWSAGRPMVEEFLLRGPGLLHLAAYLAVVVLACAGYGSVFLLLGLLFRNPVIPAGFVLGWESLNFLLPPLLKKISVIYYLESLLPVAVPQGPVTVLAEPAPPLLALAGLFLLTTAALLLATIRLSRMEVDYGKE